MSKVEDARVGDLLQALRRYQPYIAVVAAVVAVMVLLPGRSTDQGAGDFVAAGGSDADSAASGAGTGAGGAGSDAGSETDTSVAAGPGGVAAPDAAGGTGATTTAGAGGTTVAGAPVEAGPGAPPPVPAGVGANCDQATGRTKVPTSFAPPCVAEFSGDNGGATYQGVSADTITVVWYRPKADPATQAALTAAGASDTPENSEATFRAYVDYFNATYETYGRKVELVVKEGSGEADDDAAGRADAIDIATRIKPLAVISGTNLGPFVTEIAARKITCICTVSQPQEIYEGNAPYVGFTTLMSSSQGYIHRAEYMGKRLAGRNAVHAGQSVGTGGAIDLSTQKRVFGLLYYELPDGSYRSGVDFFERELAKYGTGLKVRLAYDGSSYATVQEQARPFIQRMKSEGVTSIVFAGDPIAPALFTTEATRQQYFPEWIITGSALTDTTIFARTYDQQQWNKAFGISYLAARYPQEQGDAYKLHEWFHGTAPKAGNTYAVIYVNPFILFTGIHMAGPNLNPETFARGLFAYPVTGRGQVTSQTTSWGQHGLWPFTDWTAYDDVTEIWWDPREQGIDEVGNQGAGMYRYVDGGKRYLPGEHLTTDPRVFDPNGSPSFYDERPEADRPPEYPSPRG